MSNFNDDFSGISTTPPTTSEVSLLYVIVLPIGFSSPKYLSRVWIFITTEFISLRAFSLFPLTNLNGQTWKMKNQPDKSLFRKND